MSAFDGVRVLELSTGTAGPVAAMFFSDFGADVIKVEPATGDSSRDEASYIAWNRGKSGGFADPLVDEHRERIQELAHEADLIIVPNAADMKAWGLNAIELSSGSAGAVILELPAWQGEAPWFGNEESQALLSAASGYSRRQSSFDGGPVDMVYPHLLYIQGLLGATAGAAALIERLKSGLGQIVTVDGMHAVAEAFTGNYSLDPDGEIADTAVGPRGLNPTYSHYQSSDGKWFLIGGLTPKFQDRILRAINEAWIIDDPRIAGDLSSIFSSANRDWVRTAVSARLASETREHWLAVLSEAGVPSAPLNSPAEAFDHEHTRTLGIPVTVLDPRFGEVTIVGQPIVANLTPAQVTQGAPTMNAAVTETAWTSARGATSGCGWRGNTGGRLTTQGPLSGLRVLLMGSFVAGPYGAFLLGHLGADVIKIEGPEGDPWRERGFYYSDGMRSIMVDLKKPEGRALFGELAKDADVIIDNLRPGVGANLGIDFATVAKYNPDIVSVSLTGFGHEGPLSKEPGFDPVLQAWSGMCVAQGGNDIPVLYTVPVNDVCGAALIAFGANMGLFHRLRSGEGQAISTSLVAASMFMQSGQLVKGEFASLVPQGGRDYLGPGELDRYYQTNDGWIRLQALPGSTVAQVQTALGGSIGQSPEVLLAELDSRSAVDRLNAAGIPCVMSSTAREVVLSGQHPGRFTLHRPQHGESTYYRPQQYAAFSRSNYEQRMYPPGAGEHSHEVLNELELSADTRRLLGESDAVLFGEAMAPRIMNPYR